MKTIQKGMLLLITILISFHTYAAQPKFSCILTDQVSDNKPGEPKTTFTTTTPLIYLVCQSTDVKKGQSIKATWIAVNTNNAAPANYEIDKKAIEITKNPSANEVFTGTFSLSIPNNGWPVGSYQVELSIDNEVNQTVKFNIK